MKKRFIYHFLVIWSFLIVTSCGGNGGGDTPDVTLNDLIQGTWSLGTVTANPANFVSEFTITFSQTGQNTGNVTIVINGQTLSGTYTINGTTINTTVTFNNGTVVLISVSASGTTLTFSSDLNDEKNVTETYSFNLTKQ